MKRRAFFLRLAGVGSAAAAGSACDSDLVTLLAKPSALAAVNPLCPRCGAHAMWVESPTADARHPSPVVCLVCQWTGVAMRGAVIR